MTRIALEALAGRHAGMIAHVLGNGPSRLETWVRSPHAVLIACNAAYRDLRPDYLMVSDVPIWEELVRERYEGKVAGGFPRGKLWDRMDHAKLPFDHINTNYGRPGGLHSTGLLAMWFACHLGCSEVHLFGYDGGKQNVYAGTENYAPQDRDIKKHHAQDALLKLQRIYPDVEFVPHGDSHIFQVHRLRQRKPPAGHHAGGGADDRL